MPIKPKAFDIVVNPPGSKFAKTLQQALQAKVVNTIYRRRTPRVRRSITRQHFSVTQQVLNKVAQFENFARNNISSPRFATTREAAREINCNTLFGRTLINSTNGKGIVEFKTDSETYPAAPLYTQYIPKKAEYRFHIFNGEVIDVQEKRKKRGFEEDRNTRVRNVQNGYVYCRDNIVPPDGSATLAIAAVSAVGYQYGAVDLIYNEKRAQCFVLEVNSRPGLMGTTLDKYVEALINTYSLERK